MASTPDGTASGKLTLAFFKCDSLEKQSVEKHGEYQDVIHNLFEPMLPSHLKLETKSYDVLDKREYPKDDELDHIDAIIISGSFEDDAHKDTMWILKLAGFLIKIHVSRRTGVPSPVCGRKSSHHRLHNRMSTLGFVSSVFASVCKSSHEPLARLRSRKIPRDG
jgi:hypothetical protein